MIRNQEAPGAVKVSGKRVQWPPDPVKGVSDAVNGRRKRDQTGQNRNQRPPDPNHEAPDPVKGVPDPVQGRGRRVKVSGEWNQRASRADHAAGRPGEKIIGEESSRKMAAAAYSIRFDCISA